MGCALGRNRPHDRRLARRLADPRAEPAQAGGRDQGTLRCDGQRCSPGGASGPRSLAVGVGTWASSWWWASWAEWPWGRWPAPGAPRVPFPSTWPAPTLRTWWPSTSTSPITGTGYSARVDRAIARLPYVERATYVIGFDPTLTQRTKIAVDAVAGETPPAFEGSLNGEYTTVDRATVVRGRMFDPNVQDELVMSAGGAAEYGLHVGSTFAIGVYSDAQVSSAIATGVLPDRPHVSLELKLVGIVESSSQVVEDDDAALGSQFGVFTPALTRRLATCCAGYSYVALKLDGGTRHEAAVVRAIERLVPAIGSISGGQTNASTVALVERSIRPESIAFGAFGLIAALAALLIGGQIVAPPRTRQRGRR